LLHRTTPGPGGYAARNLAIENASAEWIAFLDADDAWAPGHLAALERVIETPSSGLPLVGVFSGYENVEQNGKRHVDRYTRHYGREQVEFLDFQRLLEAWLELGDCPLWTSACAFRREILHQAGLFPAGRCRRGGDKDLWFRIGALGRLAACPAVTAIYYRDSVNMVTRNQSTNVRHCICETINATLARGLDKLRTPLQRLFNQEVFNYSVYALRGSRVNPVIWRGYFARENPLKFLFLVAASAPGISLAMRSAYSVWLRLRR
jgi:glycosyltransferase involved in cell wall biosynthesis